MWQWQLDLEMDVNILGDWLMPLCLHNKSTVHL